MFQDLITFLLFLWPNFSLGLLHTLQPCEDKAIFSFYAFGVSRDWREAFKLLNLYGAGLLTANLSLGIIFSLLGTALTAIPDIIKALIAGSGIIISGVYMLLMIHRQCYDPHSEQKKEIGTQLTRKTNSAYVLGILAGVPPCPMELAIYGIATSLAAGGSFLLAIVAVLMFSLGTWIGLYPLGILGVVGSQAKKKSKTPWRIEKISAWVMIALGVLYITLFMFGINLFQQLIQPPPA